MLTQIDVETFQANVFLFCATAELKDTQHNQFNGHYQKYVNFFNITLLSLSFCLL